MLRETGLSYGEIAKRIGVSRQRIHQVVRDSEEKIMPTTMATRIKRPESGRPARVEFISEVKRRMAEGQTHAQIKEELGIKDFKTLWRIKKYPDERLEKQREYAKISNT